MHFFLMLMLCLIWCVTIMSGVTSHSLHRHLLHHYPFFPLDSSTTTSSSVSPSPPPQPSPEELNYPFITSNPYPFFPSNPPPPPLSIASFPANISSLIFPNSSHHHHHNKLLVILILTSLSAFVLVILLALLLLLYRRCSRSRKVVVSHKPLRSENSESAPSFTETTATTATTTTTTSDGSVKMIRPPPLRSGRGIIGTSTEFLYLGTVGGNSSSEIGSPELRPLPPLPKFNPFTSGEQIITPRSRKIEEVDDEFFSPRGSSSSGSRKLDAKSRGVNTKTASFPSSNSTSPTLSVSDRTPAFVLPSPSLSSSSPEIELGRPRYPLARLSRDEFVNSSPPPPSFSNSYPKGLNMEVQQTLNLKQKLKHLHWDQLHLSSEKAMAWDDIKSSSFMLNEEIVESMFMMKSTDLVVNDKGCLKVLQSENQGNFVLDSSKSQNIAILLWASNVTTDEVCEALLEGNADALGSELLECLIKMAPSKKEEQCLKNVDDESQCKLGPDEKFLKMMLGVPYAFERMDIMLYMTRFDSEVEYVMQAYQTIQAACCELKESKMFLKLLEAVLKAGNEMNIGTNRENALASKLDTLLKLADVKGTDGKTTLLHFVVEETIRVEDQTLNLSNPLGPQDEIESRKHKLQVITSLIGELSNVKKAAEIDLTVLRSEVDKLADKICKARQNICKFTESITMFLKKADAEISRIQVQQNTAFTLAKEVNEYFHGDYSKLEVNPFRIFLVVRDFLTILDRVCKEVGNRNMRILMGSGTAHSLHHWKNPQSVFPPFNRMQQSFSDGDQRSCSMSFGLAHSSSI